MNNCFRITAYNKDLDVCLIADSNGKFEKLWQFSSFFVCKGFEIIAVGKEEDFSLGNISKANPDKNNILIRACGKGRPSIENNVIEIRGKKYSPPLNG